MKNPLLKLVLFLFVFLPTQAFSQEVFRDESAGVQLTIPGGWYYENIDNTITFYPKDKDIVVNITTYEASSIEKIIDVLVSDLSKNFSDVNLTKPAEDEINGLRGWELHGTATRKDSVEMTIEYGIYLTPTNKILELGLVTTGDIWTKYKTDIETIENGIKPIE
jgi:hypothetical protein